VVSRFQNVEEVADYAVFYGGCRTVKKPKVEKASSGEGVAYCVEFCRRAACSTITED